MLIEGEEREEMVWAVKVGKSLEYVSDIFKS